MNEKQLEPKIRAAYVDCVFVRLFHSLLYFTFIRSLFARFCLEQMQWIDRFVLVVVCSYIALFDNGVRGEALRLVNVTGTVRPEGDRPVIHDLMTDHDCAYYYKAHIHCTHVYYHCQYRPQPSVPHVYIHHYRRDCQMEREFCGTIGIVPHECVVRASRHPLSEVTRRRRPVWGWFTDRPENRPPILSWRHQTIEHVATTQQTCFYFILLKDHCEHAHTYCTLLLGQPEHELACLSEVLFCDYVSYLPSECYDNVMFTQVSL